MIAPMAETIHSNGKQSAVATSTVQGRLQRYFLAFPPLTIDNEPSL